MSKRMRVARLLEQSGATEAILRVRSRVRFPWITILNYHRVADPQPGDLFDDALIDATPDEFDAQVGTLKKYFSIVGMDELRGVLSGKKLPRNPAIITFDDGYRDNHDAALPILRRHGAKATFFISTSYITERRVFWWDRIACQINLSKRDEIVMSYPQARRFDLRHERKQAIRTFLQTVIREYGLDLARFLEELNVATGVDWNPSVDRDHAEKLVMNWDHVRALAGAGMDIASHTRTHRVLQTLRPEMLASELQGSRDDIEQQTGRRTFALSYPVSRPIVTQPALCEAVRKAGYELGFSAASGIMPLWKPFEPFDVRRLALERGMPPSYFRGILAVPSLAYSPYEAQPS